MLFSHLNTLQEYKKINKIYKLLCAAGLELAYIEAPRSMQGLIMGLFWLCQGVGSILGTATMQIFHGIWFESGDYGDINCSKCHLGYYFFFLASLQLLGIVAFIIITHWLGIGYRSTSRNNRGRYVTVTDARQRSEAILPNTAQSIQRRSSQISNLS